MIKTRLASFSVLTATAVVFGLNLSAQTPAPAKPAPSSAQPARKAATSPAQPALAVAHQPVQPQAVAAPQPDVVKQYCIGCHSEKGKAGGLSLVAFDAAHPDQQAEVAEKMIHKLRLGMMPPPGARRPAPEVLTALVGSLETKIDSVASLRRTPGRRTFQRLNRAEYQRAVHDLLDVDVDVNAFLPPDTLSAGYDNVADVQTFSATLMEGYLRAASKISSLAAGDRTASASETTIKIPRTQSQNIHIDGTPWGTRGGLAVTQTFPADGDYSFRIMLHGTPTGELFGSVWSRNEQLEISINGARVALLDIDPHMSETGKSGLNLVTPRIHIKAGPQHIAAAFIQRYEGPVDDLAAHPRLQHHRAVPGDRRLGHTEPPPHLHLPPDDAGR
jgi:mono/diheme cytochrome c family protein